MINKQMKPKTKLIRALKEIKSSRVIKSDIPEIINLLNDFYNETGNGELDDFTYTFCSMDSVLDNVAYKAHQGDFRGCQNILEGLEKDDYYKDTGDGYENIDDSDVEERLDDILYNAKNL